MSEEKKTPILHELQRFETRDIRRSEIKNGGYNPRRISPENKARLRASIEQFGLVEPPIWNKRTGNQVGSHQRISILDTMAEDPDYLLTVAVVDLSEQEEKALNVTLNARGAQGEYDADKMAPLLAELEGQIEIDLADLLSPEKELQKLLRPKLEKKMATDPSDFNYNPQFGVIVICADENEQKTVFEKLASDFREVRVVNV